MDALRTHQELCRSFASLFTYPDARTGERAVACAERLAALSPAAARAAGRFADFVAASDLSRVEEAFTGTFELQALCHPYVGYQLCGESQQRTMFMIKLGELYRQHGFVPGGDLPDHLGEVLRFVGSVDDRECRDEIIGDGLLPALEKIAAAAANQPAPYLDLVSALHSFLAEAAAPQLSAVRQKECLS